MIKHMSRRKFIKTTALSAAAMVTYHLIPGGKNVEANETGNGKTLIVYFSHSGNTRYMAGQIHKRIGGDILEIRTVNVYSNDDDTVVDQAKKEQNQNTRPELSVECAGTFSRKRHRRMAGRYEFFVKKL